jgi:hypothetical protein
MLLRPPLAYTIKEHRAGPCLWPVSRMLAASLSSALACGIRASGPFAQREGRELEIHQGGAIFLNANPAPVFVDFSTITREEENRIRRWEGQLSRPAQKRPARNLTTCSPSAIISRAPLRVHPKPATVPYHTFLWPPSHQRPPRRGVEPAGRKGMGVEAKGRNDRGRRFLPASL